MISNFFFVVVLLFCCCCHLSSCIDYSNSMNCKAGEADCVIDAAETFNERDDILLSRFGSVTLSASFLAQSANLTIAADTIIIAQQVKCLALVLRAKSVVTLRSTATLSARTLFIDSSSALVAVDAGASVKVEAVKILYLVVCLF